MKQIRLEMLAWLMSFAFLSSLAGKAETKVPCFVFSGNAGEEYCIDLASYNRITFSDNSMIISSSADDSKQSVELLYSLYHHIEVGDAIPNLGAVIDATDTDSNSRIVVDSRTKLLKLISSIDQLFSVGIFNINGQLLLTSRLQPDDAVSIKALTPGAYIAVATTGSTKLYLKFILN